MRKTATCSRAQAPADNQVVTQTCTYTHSHTTKRIQTHSQQSKQVEEATLRPTYINKCPGNRAHVAVFRTRVSVTRLRQGCVELNIVGEVWCLLFTKPPMPVAQSSPASRLIAELLGWLKISWLKVLLSGGARPLVFARARTVAGGKGFNCLFFES